MKTFVTERFDSNANSVDSFASAHNLYRAQGGYGASSGYRTRGGAVAAVNEQARVRVGGREVGGIRNSHDLYARQVATPVGGERKIAYGDRLFVRLMQDGRVVMEWVLETVSDLTELFSALHSRCRDIRGLVKLYLRNVSRGWSLVRPFMFYTRNQNKKESDKKNSSIDPRMISAASHPLFPTNLRERYFRGDVEQMSFHWDM